MAINFYKGESMTIIFTAYDNSDPAQLLDISGYTKAVTVFTPYTKPAISLTVTPISNSSFSVTVSAANTAAMNPGDFNIVVKLTDASGGVKIGKSVPCKLIDPNITTAAGSLIVDSGQVSVNMNIDSSAINFDMFFGTASIVVDGAVLDTDAALGGATPSDIKVPSQKAVKAYADNKVSAEAAARQNADDLKVDKVTGKGLSANDYDNTEKAAVANSVRKTGDETIAGVKTFSSSPIVPTPTTDTQAAPKKYVDDADALKSDKVIGATNGNFAGINAYGNLTDSGKKPADFEPADPTILKEADVSGERGVSTTVPISQKKFTDDLVQIEGEIIFLQTNKEDKSNKKSVVNNSNTEYPNSQAVRDFVYNEITSEKWNPASMALLYNPDIVVDEKTEIKPFIYPELANQSVVFQIDEGSAKVNPDGLVTAKAVGEVRIFIISTLRSRVWQEAMLTAREAEALELEDGTPVTTEDLTSIEV